MTFLKLFTTFRKCFPSKISICFPENSLQETTFQTFLCLFALEKLVNGKHFPVKGKFDLISRKLFSFYFGRKTFSRSCENFKNIILFADYVKFDLQIFYCYIFCLNLFFFKFIP
jgi:hypothetical protein